MNTKNTGGPAFPMQNGEAIHAYAAAYDGIDPKSEERERVYIQARREAIGGLTMRDYFAAAAMPVFATGLTYEFVAQQAYALADAMLAERDK